jgi:hypothetical protein
VVVVVVKVQGGAFSFCVNATPQRYTGNCSWTINFGTARTWVVSFRFKPLSSRAKSV